MGELIYNHVKTKQTISYRNLYAFDWIVPRVPKREMHEMHTCTWDLDWKHGGMGTVWSGLGLITETYLLSSCMLITFPSFLFLFFFYFSVFYEQKFRGKEGNLISRTEHIEVSSKTYRGGLSPFLSFYRLPIKRDCRQRNLTYIELITHERLYAHIFKRICNEDKRVFNSHPIKFFACIHSHSSFSWILRTRKHQEWYR